MPARKDMPSTLKRSPKKAQDTWAETHDSAVGTYGEGERALVLASIEEAAAQLAPGARAVFVLHDVEGYTHEEIARELGITTGGSK